MATRILKPEVQTESPAIQVTSLHEAVETIRDDALEHAQAKFAPSLRGLSTAELLERNDFFNYFKNGLAKGIAATLAAHDESVEAVYFTEPNLNPDAETEVSVRPDASIDLLVLVRSKSAALESFVAALDRTLTQKVKELPSASLATLGSILNVILITEEDVAQRRGYAVLLSSMFAKPRQIWQRN